MFKPFRELLILESIDASNLSSEKEHKKTRSCHKSSKKAEIKVDREEVVKVKQDELPPDAKFKG